MLNKNTSPKEDRKIEERARKVDKLYEQYGRISGDEIIIYLIDRLDNGTDKLNILTIVLIILTVILALLEIRAWIMG